MKRKYIVISVVFTIILFLILIYVEKKISGSADVKEVLVVKQNLSIDRYTKLDSSMFETKKVPEFLAADAVESFDKINSMYALDNLYGSEILHKVKVGNKNDTPVVDVDPGKRQIAIPVTSLADGAAGQVRKGVYVDILFTNNPTTDEPVIKTETLFQKVKVLGVTDSNGLLIDESGSGQTAAVLAAVTPQDAHMLTNKERKGKFRLIVVPESAAEYEKVVVK